MKKKKTTNSILQYDLNENFVRKSYDKKIDFYTLTKEEHIHCDFLIDIMPNC
jgi:hypothetical protein